MGEQSFPQAHLAPDAGVKQQGLAFSAYLSVDPQSGRIGQANYAAAKAGQFGLTKVLALETATKGVTVNCVVPGGIETDMVAALPEEILKAAIDLIPMHALGKPDDVAEAVRYLVSDEAHYLTGTLLTVAGGLLMM
jgi:acetoacetyl-CoA reductase